MARALRRCVSHHEKTGRTNEILRQSHPDDDHLHRHLLDLHGAAASTGWRVQSDALLWMVHHSGMCGNAKWWLLYPRRHHASLRRALSQWSHTHPRLSRRSESKMKRSAMNLETVSMPPLPRLAIIAVLTGAIALVASVLVARAAEPTRDTCATDEECAAVCMKTATTNKEKIKCYAMLSTRPEEDCFAEGDCIKEAPKPVRWQPWQQVWQCNDIRMTITSRTQGLIEYDLGGSIWGGSRFAVDFRRDPWGKYWFNGRPCIQITGVR